MNEQTTHVDNNDKPQLFPNQSLFSNSGSLFGKIEEKKNDNINEDKKETHNFEAFNKNNNIINNNTPSLFGNNKSSNENNIKTNENQNQSQNSTASFAGSLANKNNPFLNPSSSVHIQNVFTVEALNNNNKDNNTQNGNLFQFGNNNNTNKISLFNNNTFNNNGQTPSLFGNQNSEMNTCNMNVSPQFGARKLFNDNTNIQYNNSQSLFSGTNNVNIFGAPNNISNTTLFNSNNSQFPKNSGGLFTNTSFSQGSNNFSGFSIGKVV